VNPPVSRRLEPYTVIREEIIMNGIAAMPQRGMVRVVLKDGWHRLPPVECVVAPPLVNGGFEMDSTGHGTPDLWSGPALDLITQMLQLKELPPGVADAHEVLHHADGYIDPQQATEGKNGLLLPGRLLLPYTWCRDVRSTTPITNQPCFFKTGQPLILKAGTRYRLSFMYRQESADGQLEVSGETSEWPCREKPAFSLQKIQAVSGKQDWQKFSCDFVTPRDLAGTPDLLIVNKSAGRAWLDAVAIQDLGTASADNP